MYNLILFHGKSYVLCFMATFIQSRHFERKPYTIYMDNFEVSTFLSEF